MDEGSQYRTVPAGTVGIYRIDQCTDIGTPLFCTGKNTGHTGHTSEFWLFRPVNGYRAETRFCPFLGSQSQGNWFPKQI